MEVSWLQEHETALLEEPETPERQTRQARKEWDLLCPIAAVQRGSLESWLLGPDAGVCAAEHQY